MSEDLKPRQDNGIDPLPGEAGIPSVAPIKRGRTSRKEMLTLVVMAVSLVVVAGISIQRTLFSTRHADVESKSAGDRPAAAGAEPRKLDLSAPTVKAPAASAPTGPVVPAIIPSRDDGLVEPIGVHRTGESGPANASAQHVSPEDAPAVLMSGRPGNVGTGSSGTVRTSGAASTGTAAPEAADSLEATKQNLQEYQRQLQRLIDDLNKKASSSGSSVAPSREVRRGGTDTAATGNGSGEGLFGGQLQASATPRINASTIANRSLTLPKGTAFTCALKTKLVSAASGFVACQTQRNVYSEDGRVLLIERGSHIDGEYRSTSVHPGTVRIPVLWTRIRTPNGVTMNIESPGTGPLGESGVDGYVDNRWVERIGAAMLLSLVDDSVSLLGQDKSGAQSTVVLPSTTANTDKLAEKVLDSTINIPPLIYNNQGGIVGIYVARDVDFSAVYELKATKP